MYTLYLASYIVKGDFFPGRPRRTILLRRCGYNVDIAHVPGRCPTRDSLGEARFPHRDGEPLYRIHNKICGMLSRYRPNRGRHLHVSL